MEADPVFNALTAAKDGNVVWVTDPNVIGAFSYASVLSLPYALDALVPELAAVVAGRRRDELRVRWSPRPAERRAQASEEAPPR